MSDRKGKYEKYYNLVRLKYPKYTPDKVDNITVQILDMLEGKQASVILSDTDEVHSFDGLKERSVITTEYTIGEEPRTKLKLKGTVNDGNRTRTELIFKQYVPFTVAQEMVDLYNEKHNL